MKAYWAVLVVMILTALIANSFTPYMVGEGTHMIVGCSITSGIITAIFITIVRAIASGVVKEENKKEND